MKKGLLLLSVLCFAFLGFSQEAQQAEEIKDLTNGTISEQFDYIHKKSNNYQDFKVIKKEELRILKINVLDSLNEQKEAIRTYKTEINNRNNQISSDRQKMIAMDDKMTQTIQEKDSIIFFGSLISKGAYKSIMWGIVGALLLVSLIFAFRAFQNGIAKKEAKSALAVIQEEFDIHTKRSLEREQKLNRALQDERNKNI